MTSRLTSWSSWLCDWSFDNIIDSFLCFPNFCYRDFQPDDSRKAKTLDRKFVRRPPPERSSGYIRRSYGNDLDFDYGPGSRTMPRKMRKYVPLITKEELMRAYSSGGLHDESVIRSNQDPAEDNTKIEYSLKDESGEMSRVILKCQRSFWYFICQIINFLLKTLTLIQRSPVIWVVLRAMNENSAFLFW